MTVNEKNNFNSLEKTMRKRKTRIQFLLDVLKAIEKLSTCKRRHVAAIVFDPNTYNIISYGYNGAPKKVSECNEIGCIREQKNIKSGEKLNLCIASHAEENAIVNASALGNVTTKNMAMICSAKPCLKCLKTITNAEIKLVYYKENYSIPKEEQEIYNRIVNDTGIILTPIDKVYKLTYI